MGREHGRGRGGRSVITDHLGEQPVGPLQDTLAVVELEQLVGRGLLRVDIDVKLTLEARRRTKRTALHDSSMQHVVGSFGEQGEGGEGGVGRESERDGECHAFS